MALESLVGIGSGGAGIPDRLPKILKELQGIRFSAAPGVAANADIAVDGIALTDTVHAILNVTDGANCAAPTINSAGNVRTTTDTTGKMLIVVWFDKE